MARLCSATMSLIKNSSALNRTLILIILSSSALILILATTSCHAVFSRAKEVTNPKVLGFFYQDGIRKTGIRSAIVPMEQKDCGRVPAMVAKLPRPKKKKNRISTGFKALKGQFPRSCFSELEIEDKKTLCSVEVPYCGAMLF